MKEILRLEDVGYSYEEGRIALSQLTVALYGGEKVAVLGNNGAGKSTFFLCCNGVLTPEAGKIYLEGREISKKKSEKVLLRKSVGLIFQDPDSQIIAGNVEAEISFGPMNLRLPLEEVRRRVDEAVENMQLETFRRRAPQYLSGGEKKRVSIADVLAMEPKLLLLDEPAASLDPANTRLLERNLEVLSRRGLGLVIATHDVDFAWRWADRALVFHNGRLQADASPEAVFENKELLERCGLEQPLLYQAGVALGMNPLPKRIEEIKVRANLG